MILPIWEEAGLTSGGVRDEEEGSGLWSGTEGRGAGGGANEGCLEATPKDCWPKTGREAAKELSALATWRCTDCSMVS